METLKKYTQIKYQIKALTEEAKTLEKEAKGELELLEEEGVDVKFDWGTPYFMKREKWEWGLKVKQAEDIIKEEVEKVEKKYKPLLDQAKEEEVKSGIAKVVVNKILAIRAK